MCLYVGDMNLNRNNDKKYVEIQKKYVLKNKTVRTFLYFKMFYSPIGCLASIMF